ncbi:MAG: transcriptional regulator with XRE-family HTH domain [Saprospiraceae bacterium]|jgi:transcriptional regulator with XRE-family HTH domain
MKFGAKIRTIRREKGWSQEYVSRCLKMSQTNYSKIEKDEVKLTIDRIVLLSGVFEMTLIDFLDKCIENKNILNGGGIITQFNPRSLYFLRRVNPIL